MDWVTVITTLIAAIAPTVISIANSMHQTKINTQNNEHQLKLNEQSNSFQLKSKKLENYYLDRTNSINNYLESLITYLHDQSQENFINYQLAMSKICMYVSSSIYNNILDIHYLIQKSEFDKIINEYLELLLDELNKEVKQYQDNN